VTKNHSSVDPFDSQKFDVLNLGFLPGGNYILWGYEVPKQGVQDEASE